jgi:amino acid adenylation domain-containing protein
VESNQICAIWGKEKRMNEVELNTTTGLEVAIVGMAGRFPGAENIDAFWRNLREGVESISSFSREEAEAAGVDPALLDDPRYVRAEGVLDNPEWFDAGFFGLYPREAEVVDPQQRVFMECAWEALEHAGYDPERYPGLIGLFAGVGLNTYLWLNLLSNRAMTEAVHPYQLALGNDKDFLPTRISYKLNLRGPSVNVQTACSTSLVAVHLACQSLLNFQCDMALAGGVTIRLPQKQGYLYQEGNIASPDGHCRAFDAQAAGTVAGNGAGLVVLKRLADALNDGDTVHAVIKGSAINNDGALKVGYTAPSVDGQAEVISMAQALAGIHPETLQYIEAHGTGTALGDPIEIAALTQAFRTGTSATGFCALGSVKTNVGHLDTAAGVTGLIKAVLALKHKLIPPSLHYTVPNPQIDFANSPFYVNAALSEWKAPADGGPRRAGVSSFGIGGTNAHVILEEASNARADDGRLLAAKSARTDDGLGQLIVMSARSASALDAATANLTAYLRAHPDLNLADVAYTAQVGRRAFNHRRAVVGTNALAVAAALEARDPARVFSGVKGEGERPVAFMFTGQGAQFVDMARDLYEREPVFRQHVDDCAERLRPALGLDLRTLIYPAADSIPSGAVEEREEAARRLNQTAITQPALFVLEYALAQLWMSWGIQPGAMIGHSIGEYVAACLAGVFSLDDALELVAARGRLMQSMPPGSMLSVPLSEAEVRPLLTSGLTIAAINAPGLCVVSGPAEAVDAFEQQLRASGVEGRRLHTSHAFHSAMMEPILRPFIEQANAVEFHPPSIPFISNVTGTWITPADATDPRYWARHLRQAVRFADGVDELMKEAGRVFLEVGPGRTLSQLANLHLGARGRVIVSSLRHPQSPHSDVDVLLGALGQLWIAGVNVDWAAFHRGERRQRVPLPTYPFERQRYWVTPDHKFGTGARPAEIRKRPNVADWFYAPSWKRADVAAIRGVGESPAPTEVIKRWLVFSECDLGSQLSDRLKQMSQDVMTVRIGATFDQLDERTYTLDPRQPEQYATLLAELAALDQSPNVIAHLWSLNGHSLAEARALGYDSLLYLAQALGQRPAAAQVGVVTAGAHEVTGTERLNPAQALAVGLCKIIPQEYPPLTCRNIDVEPDTPQRARLVDRLIAELSAPSADVTVAYRGAHRWVQTFEPLDAPTTAAGSPLRDGGVYLITGGLGRVGRVLAESIARAARAKLVLVGRRDPAGLTALQELGADVLVLRADVSQRDQLQAAIAQAEQKFGPLNGVIHAAGLVGDQSLKLIPDTTVADGDAQFAPKVHGLHALAEALGDRDLDFVLLTSSLASVLGGLGFAAYAAANSFMDAFAHQQRQAGRPWVSVNWDGWRFGEAQALVRDLSITPDEGAAAFQKLLALNELPQVLISTGNLSARLDQWVKRQAAAEAPPPSGPADAAAHARPSLSTDYVAPRTALEQAIAAMWGDVLGIEPIGVNDDFFALGGHSLLATQLASRLRDAFKVELPLRRLFEAPTIAGVAALIDEARGNVTTAADTRLPLSRRDGLGLGGDGDLPLSFAQQRLWFLDQLEPGSPLYNNPAAVRLTGPLNVAALERSLNAIVKRHDVLRTAFTEAQGQPAQTILPELTVPVPLIDLRPLPAADRDAEAQRLAKEEAARPFDLRQPPLLRVTLLRMDEAEHIVLLTMHHIISDGWSVGVLMNELAALYTAFATEGMGGPTLPELPIQYADFAAWQRQWMAGEVRDLQLAYWKKQLGGAVYLELPTDRPRPPVQGIKGETQWFSLPSTLVERLKSIGQEEDATLFMTLLAAIQTLLHRYTGQDDISVGTPIAGRNRVETEALIGFFVNTLVLRGRLDGVSGPPSFRELLRQARERALEAYAHQDLPFEMIVEAVQPERDLSRTPLFQVMFVLQNAPAQALELPNVTLTPLPFDSGMAKFDLTITMEEGPDGLRGLVNYSRDLFDAATITRLIGHLWTLLEGIAGDPDRSISALPLLREAEQYQLLEEWNQTATGEAPAPLVHQAFEFQAERTPDAISATMVVQSLTYRELNRRANQLAHYLRASGVGPGVRVGVGVDRSLDMLIGLLGVLKAGGVYVPLDPDNPPERLAYIRNDSGLEKLLTQQKLLAHVPAEGVEPVCLDSDWPIIAQYSTSNPDYPGSPADPAYIIYTSGSTGHPKGVVVSHGALAGHCRNAARHYGLTSADRALQFASLNFDPSLEQIFTALSVGATLALRGPEVLTGPEFNEFVLEQRLTVVNVPPAYWQQWAQAAAEAQTPNPYLRLVILGGDVVLPETVRLWQTTPLRATRLLNAYGPTEATITALTYEVPLPLGESVTRLPIGRPLPNRAVYILDRYGHPTPVGVPGELHIGGEGLAEGYWNQPQLTAEQFILVNSEQWIVNSETPPPFIVHCSRPKLASAITRLYKTGDLARYLPDGNIEFLGRIDQQVKIRGFRVELGEIEAALGQHPAVSESVVVAHDSGPGMKTLVAYVVTKAGDPSSTLSNEQSAPSADHVSGLTSQAPLVNELRRDLRQRLPDYMVPSTFMLMEKLPLNTNGKVDRKALPPPDKDAGPARTDYLAPRTPIERELAQTWADVLGLDAERVGVHDSFFDLGGHSLLATQLISRVRERYQVDLPLRRLFETPTVAGLAALIPQSLAAETEDEALARLLLEIEGLSDEAARTALGAS